MRFFAKYTVALVFVCGSFAMAAPVRAQEVPGGNVAAQETAVMKAQLDAKQQALLNSPPGVFDVEYEGGQLRRLKIKGEAEVPTSLKGARADRQAREKAERAAKAAFSKFLNEQVTVVESDTETFIIKEKDGTETAEYLNASAKTMTSLSNSFLRGLVVLFDHTEGEGPNRKSVIVLGWSKKLVDAAQNAQSTMEKSRQDQPQAPAPKPVEVPANTGTTTRTGDVENF